MNNQREKEQATDNHSLEYLQSRNKSQYLFSKSAYFTETVNIDLFENSLHATSTARSFHYNELPTRKREDIKSFSANSRTRLFKLFSELSYSSCRKIYFLSLSFHEDYPTNNIELKKFLDILIKAIRRIDNNISFMWRFELQERGAPHFHFIFFVQKADLNFRENIFERKLRSAWLKRKGCNCEHCLKYSFKLIPLESFRKCISYVSKYVAKVDSEFYTNYKGRHWGRSDNLPRITPATLSLPCYRFIYLKKLLYDYYKTEASKRDYIKYSIPEICSWFLFLDTQTCIHLFNKALYDDRKYICECLMKNKILPNNLVFDEIDILIQEDINFINNRNL